MFDIIYFLACMIVLIFVLLLLETIWQFVIRVISKTKLGQKIIKFLEEE